MNYFTSFGRNIQLSSCGKFRLGFSPCFTLRSEIYMPFNILATELVTDLYTRTETLDHDKSL